MLDMEIPKREGSALEFPVTRRSHGGKDIEGAKLTRPSGPAILVIDEGKQTAGEISRSHTTEAFELQPKSLNPELKPRRRRLSDDDILTNKNRSQTWEEKPELNQLKRWSPGPRVWDCGSTLYDSFELNSFKRQLDSAITASARALSMPHLPERRAPLPPSPSKKPTNKLSRYLRTILRSVFRAKHRTRTPISSDGQYYVVYDKAGALTTIPEDAENDVCPEIGAGVRKTASERFTASQIAGIWN